MIIPKWKTKTYFYNYKILPSGIDHSDHLNNAAYLTIFENARWSMIQDNGFSGITLQKETQIAPVLLEVTLKFKRELRLNQDIQIKTNYESFNTKIAILNQEMSHQDSVCCVGSFKFALFNLTQRRMITPSDIWLKALGLN
jgi:YbgC/YbaW family acyl-CoA thioester hydrolase